MALLPLMCRVFAIIVIEIFALMMMVLFTVVDAQTSLPLLRWCLLPRNNGIVALDLQWCRCPHCNGVIAVLKLASSPCFSLQKAAQVRLDNLGFHVS
jgi:hypothetical protein